MSVIKLQRRLQGSINRISWQSEDLARLARHFKHEGPLAPLMSKREAPPQLADLAATLERSEGSAQVYTWVISTAAVDHMLDSIAVGGWNLSIHRSNPVVLFSHNSDALPVGRAIWAGVEGGKLKSKMMFSADGFAQRVRKMVDEGTLRATSVGFRPGEWEFSKDPKRPGGVNFLRGHTLLEFSIVPIPANAQCLLERAGDAAAHTDEPAQRAVSEENAKFAARVAAARRRAR